MFWEEIPVGLIHIHYLNKAPRRQKIIMLVAAVAGVALMATIAVVLIG